MSSDGPRRALSAEEFRQLANEPGYRTELVRGRVVHSPGPGARHGEIEANLVFILKSFLRRHPVGVLLSGGTSYVLDRGPDTVRGPDVSFVLRHRMPQHRLPDSWLEQAPDLAIEILSPSNRPIQLRQRMSDLFRGGCREVWVMDPRRETVTIERPESAPTILKSDGYLESSLLPGFGCRVSEFFRSD